MRIQRSLVWFLPLALAACQTPPPPVFSSLEPSTELLSVSPADIAVLPIEDRTADRTAGAYLAAIREEISVALVDRLYSPLAADRIDAVLAEHEVATSVVDASWLKGLGGRFGEDATLGVRVNKWDESSLMATAIVRFSAEVRMVSPRASGPLWQGVFEGEVKAGGTGPAPRGAADRRRAAARQFAIELIRQLPQRRP